MADARMLDTPPKLVDLSLYQGDARSLFVQWLEADVPKPGAADWTGTGTIRASRSSTADLGTVLVSWHDSDNAVALVTFPADVTAALPLGAMSCVYDVTMTHATDGPVTLLTGSLSVKADVTP